MAQRFRFHFATRLRGGALIGYSANQWEVATSQDGIGFPVLMISTEIGYTLQGHLRSRALVINEYDSSGNVLVSSSRTYDGLDGDLAVDRTAENSYFPTDWSNWRFGKLRHASVRQARPGVADITRNSGFEYDTATGLLVRETLEPGDGQFEVVTTYSLDHWGNRVRTDITGRGMASRGASVSFDAKAAAEIQNVYMSVCRLVDISTK